MPVWLRTWVLPCLSCPAAAAAVLVAAAALAGAHPALAVTDTFKVVFQDNDNVLAG